MVTQRQSLGCSSGRRIGSVVAAPVQLNGEHWTVLQVFSGDEKVVAEPFPAAEGDLAAIWGPTEESPP
jgi:hypothetical protein